MLLLLLRLLLVPNLLLLLIMPTRLRRDLAKLARIHENDSEQLEKRATHVRNGALPFSLSPPLSGSRGSARFLWSAQREETEVAIIHRKI